MRQCILGVSMDGTRPLRNSLVFETPDKAVAQHPTGSSIRDDLDNEQGTMNQGGKRAFHRTSQFERLDRGFGRAED